MHHFSQPSPNAAVRHGDPDLLVNITNDAWFGPSTEPEIHLALAKFRAVEHHRWLVRATNSGISAFVDPLGRAYGETPLFQAVGHAEEVGWLRMKTAYEVLGDAPWWIGTFAVLIMGVVRRRPGARLTIEV